MKDPSFLGQRSVFLAGLSNHIETAELWHGLAVTVEKWLSIAPQKFSFAINIRKALY